MSTSSRQLRPLSSQPNPLCRLQLRNSLAAQTDIQTISSIDFTKASATLRGGLHWVTGNCTVEPRAPCPPSTWTLAATYTLTFQAHSSARLDYNVSWAPAPAADAAKVPLNRLAIRFATLPEERFYGLGIQTSSW